MRIDDQDNNQTPNEEPSSSGMPMPGPQIFESDDNPKVYINNWTNFIKSGEQAATQSSVVRLYRSVRNTVNDADTDSPVLNSDQIDDLRKNRPGLGLYTGIRQKTANAIVNDYDSNQARQNILSHAEPTIWGGISGFAGTMSGSLITDPLATGAAIGVGILQPETIPEMVGAESQTMGQALVERTASRVAKGALEGAAFSATQEGAKKIEDATNGDTFDSYRAGLNIGANMFWGGALHSLGGFISDQFKKPAQVLEGKPSIGTDASLDTSQTATQMLGNGQDPQVDFPIKNGFTQQVQKLHQDMFNNNISSEDMLNALDSAKGSIDESLSPLNDQLKPLDDALSDANLTWEQVKNINSQMEDPEDFSPIGKLFNKISPILQAAQDLSGKDSIDDAIDEINPIWENRKDLQMRSKSEEVYRAMVNSPEQNLTKENMNEYVNNVRDPENDYVNGIGQQSPDVEGAPIKSQKSLLEDRFPDDYKKELLDNTTLTDDEQNELDEINKKSQAKSALRKALDRTIMCLGGTAGE